MGNVCGIEIYVSSLSLSLKLKKITIFISSAKYVCHRSVPLTISNFVPLPLPPSTQNDNALTFIVCFIFLRPDASELLKHHFFKKARVRV